VLSVLRDAAAALSAALLAKTRWVLRSDLFEALARGRMC
jgi:hypothetical protein